MNNHLPSFYELKYFQKVAEAKNLSMAAKVLGLSQPSLSISIKKLEEIVGAILFIRTKKGVQLTPAGQKLYIKSKKIFEYWEELRKEILGDELELRGTYSIGLHASVAQYILDLFMPALLQKYTELNINLVHDRSKEIARKVINLELDFGLVINPTLHPDLTLVHLTDDQVKFWVAKNPSAVQKIDSEHAVVICDSALDQVGKLLKDAQTKTKFTPKRFVYSSNLEVICELTHKGAGIGLLPQKVVNKHYQGQLKELNGMPVYKDKLYLIFRKDVINSLASKTLKDFICKSIKNS